MTIKTSSDVSQFYFQVSITEFQRFVQDLFCGHIVYVDHVESADPKVYLEYIRQKACQYLEYDLWGALYVEGVTHPTQIRLYSVCEEINGIEKTLQYTLSVHIPLVSIFK